MAVFVALSGLLQSAPVSAQLAPERFDLADAVLMPRDLDQVGLPGFAVDRAAWIDSGDALSTIGNLFDVDDREFEDAFDPDAVFAFAYDTVLALAVDDGPYLVEVRNTLAQFESAHEAEDAFNALADVVDNDNAVEGNVWGDQSIVSSTPDVLVIAIQAGQMLSVVGIDSDYMEFYEQRAYFVTRMANLADQSVASIGAALDRSGPELGATAVRFESEQPDRVVAGDRYIVDRGQFVPLTTSQTFLVSFMGIQVDAFRIESSYERFLYPAGLEGAIVNIAITRHQSTELAEKYVHHAQDRLDFGGGFGNLQAVVDLDLPGDSAAAFTYTVTYSEDLVTTGLAVAVQVEDQVISIEVDSTDGVDEDEVLAIVEMQVSCLAGEECEAVPYPGD